MIKLYSWNVNGIRAVNRKELWIPFIEAEKPDLVCLQEIKAKEDQIDASTEGYSALWYPAEKPGYSGTGILTKLKPKQVINGYPEGIIKKHDLSGDTYGDPNKEGRVLTAEFDEFYLISVYTPNAKDDLSRLDLKFKHWDPAFLQYVKRLKETKPVIICGDINVAHTEDDLANPKPNIGKKGFTDEERSGFQALLDAGFIDSFRQFHKGNGHYSWWSHFAKSRERNVGWRIDYILVSEELKDKLVDANIHANILGSDHCPISVTLNL
jgi:exodeoxyribonuclease-3